MTSSTNEQQEGLAALQATFKAMAEQQEREYAAHKAAARASIFSAIPKEATSLYIHLSHRIPSHPFIEQIQKDYGSDNVLVTIAPPTSGQSFYDNHLDEIAKIEKTKRVIEPFENFSAKKSIDAILYLCNYLCDGYQSPIFPEDVVTGWHIWRPIRVAEQLQKPLIIGYQDRFCFGVKCYEREYITDPEKIKCPTKVVNISHI
ncbi:hypothetical protein HYU22_05050 [Candidatus Woesearchaeota archaeon]|nr:hypothetical protein [Candidatus Woesearchaeota archaeon]